MRAELRQDSVAGIVLDAAASFSRPPRRAVVRVLAEGSLAAVVLGTSSSQRGLISVSLFGLAVALHAGAGFAALASHGKDRVDVGRTERPSLLLEHVVDLQPEAPPPPQESAPPPVTKARSAERVPDPEPPAPTPPSESPPPPAEAGQVVAADESASQPLDFTGFDISIGSAERYAGGITASSGTNARAVRTRVVDRPAEPAARGATSRARPVGPPARDWDCPWPAEAGALSIDEQFVVIRAVVRENGTVTSAELISEPGYGFGEVALACVRRQSFPPATDDDGRPITATSPPIRVRFTRP